MKILVWRHFKPKSSCFQVHKQMKIRNLELYPALTKKLVRFYRYTVPVVL